MPGSSVFFYGLTSRSSRTFDDPTSSYSSSSSSASQSNPSNSDHRNRRRITADHHRRRHRHAFLDDVDRIRPPSHSSFLSPPLPESELQQTGCFGESSSQEINTGETVRDISRRFSRNNRLPGPVLLAKERLLQRLRSVSVSGSRQRRERSPSFHRNDFWVVDADWETSGFIEPPSANSSPTQSPVEETKKKPLGLSKETLSQIHHEVFLRDQNTPTRSTLNSSNECSICLENFVEGNELVSLPCNHRFHTLCLYPWLQTCGECPYCRSCIIFGS
ncbi:hypothetical protein KSS87_009836 [Heliosperma pusillum]|nr:hypothetical protein KSS87_009836 [Heliosperma pusillum]